VLNGLIPAELEFGADLFNLQNDAANGGELARVRVVARFDLGVSAFGLEMGELSRVITKC
jgi:hypothetical protein